MFREFLNNAFQKKFFIMFCTCVIYILGLCAYFTGSAPIYAFFLMIVGVFLIFKNLLSPKLALFLYFVFFFAFFNASFRVKDYDYLYQIAPVNAKIYGRVVSIPVENNNKIKFFFDVSKVFCNGKSVDVNTKTLVSLYFPKKPNTNFDIGQTYILDGKLRAPFKVTNPSQFDYGKYLRNYGVYTLFYADSTVKGCDSGLGLKWKFLRYLNGVRNDIISSHSKFLKSPNLELLGGIVFGDDAISPPEGLKKSFQRSGLLHLLAASGMNVALVYGIWFFILSKLKVPFKPSVISGIFVVIFYSLMTGLGPSVVRAAFMLIFILLGKLIDRDAHSVSLLSFVALLMLIYNPAYINDVGFQLSFIVTFGLLIMCPIIFEKFDKIPQWLSGAVFVPVIAQLWVAPIQMYYFNSFSLYSVFANVVTLPFVTVVSFGGFVSSVLALIKPLASVVCLIFDWFLNPVLNCLVWISDYFANLPHSMIVTIQPSVVQILIYYAIISLFVYYLKIGFAKKRVVLLVCLTFIFLFSFIQLPNHNLETVAFDVKNADAFLIKTPENKFFIIDTGKEAYNGGKSQAQFVILPYLKDNGIKNVEGLILTHFDSDHAGGAVDLFANLNVKNVYVNSLKDKSKLAKLIYKVAGKKLVLAKNNTIIYKEKNIVIRNFRFNLKSKDVDNDSSILTLVSDGAFDELFMGDAGYKIFDKLEKYLPDRVEVLKVAHHGAKNVITKQIVDRIKPQVAIVSTGQNNYGHPNGVTINLLKAANVKVLRTDKMNSIKIEENAGKYSVFSYSNSRYNFIYKF